MGFFVRIVKLIRISHVFFLLFFIILDLGLQVGFAHLILTILCKLLFQAACVVQFLIFNQHLCELSLKTLRQILSQPDEASLELRVKEWVIHQLEAARSLRSVNYQTAADKVERYGVDVLEQRTKRNFFDMLRCDDGLCSSRDALPLE